ncbi:MAG TPA: TonB family protein, partial [Polyangiaceae bacterium]|nr:TonB family protein [Polyangiaceae bacterium]
MRSWLGRSVAGAYLVALGLCTEVRAQEPAGAAPADAPEMPDQTTAPVLRDHPDATYPDEALRERIEGEVALEVTVDITGHVSDVRVVRPAGHGFDEAALQAVRAWTFEPARRNGEAIASTVLLTYPFALPPLAPVAPSPAPPVGATLPPGSPPAAAPPPSATPDRAPMLQASPQSSLVLGRRPISAASSFSVRDRDFSLRPVGSVQDILRVTPGLVMVQHSGGGKANQYFLRGFDADHGTDLALSIDGIPINMPSHAHGQGFADTNFIIPETVERVEITKGPYFANQGDFATAGSVNLVTRDGFQHSSIGFGGGGSPGHGAGTYRGLIVASPKWELAKATFAAEIGRQNGPFDNPEGWDKFKLFNKVTFPLGPTSSITIGEESYGGNWHGSGQIPVRAVEQGLVSRFGSIDPNEGGSTGRHQVFATYKVRPSENSELNVLAYVGTYRFNLFSNFTLYLDDPENGDEIEQVDRRTFYGGKASYRVVHQVRGVRFDTSMGVDVRSDDIHEELWHTRQRVQLSATRSNDVHETLAGVYVSEEITPWRWLRLNFGGRSDVIFFAVDNLLQTDDPTNPQSGTGSQHQFRPKANLVLTPLDRQNAQLDLYVNYGNGFHSNDVRGVFTTPSVTPLTKAVGQEVGARARLFERLDLASALWRMTLSNETLWNGDDGTTEVSPATLRYGVELESRLEITSWLAADADVTFTHSQFSRDQENGNGLALAPKKTWSGGLSARHDLGPGVARGGLRFYGIGDRPA